MRNLSSGTLHGNRMGGPSHEVMEIGRAIAAVKAIPQALDLGSGIGRNSIFLAGEGFQTTAVEKDPAKVSLAQRAQTTAGTQYRIIQTGVEEFSLGGPYDLCLLLGILHFLPNATARGVVADLKAATSPSGIHVITASHSDGRRFFANTLAAQHHLNSFGERDIRECYADWDILSYESYIKRDNHLEGSIDVHPIEKFVVSKPTGGKAPTVVADTVPLAKRADQAHVDAMLSADFLSSTLLANVREQIGYEDFAASAYTFRPQLRLLPSDREGYRLTIGFWGLSKGYFEDNVLVGYARYDAGPFHMYRPHLSSRLPK